MPKNKLDKIREEAVKLLQKNKHSVMMRSCWECNPAHEHLKKATDEFLLKCFECQKLFFKGVDITLPE